MDEIVNCESVPISQLIKLKRKEKGMTQTDLAEAAGLSLPSITKYESGERIPKLDALVRLNNILDLNLASFFTDGKESVIFKKDDVLSYEVTYRESDGVSVRKLRFKYNFTGMNLRDRDKTILALIKAYDNQKKGESFIGLKVKDE